MRSWGLLLLWLVLLDVRPTLTDVNVYRESKGADLMLMCSSNIDLKVTRRVFCKNDCEEGDVLVQTSGNKETNGRHSIEHEKEGSPPVDYITVKISNLALSDSGRYRCFWDRPVRQSFCEFRIDVIDGLKESKVVVSLAAGKDFSRLYTFSKPGKKKILCRNICVRAEDILVEMTGDEGKSGRYKIEYKKYADDLTYIYVTIRNVSVADSGVYRVELDGTYHETWIDVAPAPHGGVPVTARPSAVAPEQESTGTLNPVLILGLVLVCLNVIITGTIMIICRRRRTGQRTGAGGRHNPEREYEYVNAHPESERIYEALCLEEMEPQYSVLPGGVA